MESHGELLTKNRVKKPSMYRVIMHNDHFTTMDFVISILVGVFLKPKTEAHQIMLDVHRKGSGLCGIYPKDIAETKVAMVHQKARKASFPLKCSIEKE